MICSYCGGHGEVSDDAPVRLKAADLERGWRKTWLEQELADGTRDRGDLARHLACHPVAIASFERKHAREIDRLREDASAAMRALWIAEKTHRIAEYQMDAEDLASVIASKLGDEGDASDLPTWTKAKGHALRAVAEELGQLPQRISVPVAGNTVVYKLEGVDVGDV